MLDRVKQGFYEKYSNPSHRQYLRQYRLEPKILIEAGCHHAEDTIQLISELKLNRVFAFEADPDAFAISESKLSKSKIVTLFDFGLGEKSGRSVLFINELEPENGTAGFNFHPSNKDEWRTTEIEIRTLDETLLNVPEFSHAQTSRDVFLWLDVEGFEHKVLIGGKKILEFCSVAQIEVNMHNFLRQANYLEVFRIMRGHGFWLAYAPLHPGFFGDAVFVHREVSKGVRHCLRDLLLTSAMITLHSFVYPILKKPK